MSALFVEEDGLVVCVEQDHAGVHVKLAESGMVIEEDVLCELHSLDQLEHEHVVEEGSSSAEADVALLEEL